MRSPSNGVFFFDAERVSLDGMPQVRVQGGATGLGLWGSRAELPGDCGAGSQASPVSLPEIRMGHAARRALLHCDATSAMQAVFADFKGAHDDGLTDHVGHNCCVRFRTA